MNEGQKKILEKLKKDKKTITEILSQHNKSYQDLPKNGETNQKKK